MMASERKVLIVEDERMIAEYFRVVVERLGYVVCGIAGTADDAVRLAAEEDPSVVFMDVRLPGERDGVDAALEIHSNRPVPMVHHRFTGTGYHGANQIRPSSGRTFEAGLGTSAQRSAGEALPSGLTGAAGQ